jgi:hypothetical protein
MTLATIFLFASLTAPVGSPRQTAMPPAPAGTGSEKQEGTSTQAQTQKKQSGAKVSQQKSSASSTSSSAKRRRRKKKVAQPCNSPASSGSNTTAATGTQPDAGQSSTQTSAQQAPTNCPPPKIVVQQGGTAEPSIQLAGGPNPDQAAQKRDAVNQLLAQTDQNLKKTAELQLSADQQDTVAQTRQFMEQSKAAMATGDFERARTLAWKAEVLSEDLVKPQK